MATTEKDQAGSMLSADLRTARRTGALLDGIVALQGQEVKVVMCVHDGYEVDPRWVRKGNSKTEGREIEDGEIVRRREAVLVACDPAPSCSQRRRVKPGV